MIPHGITLALSAFLVTGHPDAQTLRQYADSFGVPAEVVWAVAAVETGHATDNRSVGAAGELGRFQLRPEYFSRSYRRECGLRPLTDYRTNICRGVRRIRECYDLKGTWPDAIACYNGRGRAAVRYRDKVLGIIGRYYVREIL